MENKIINLTSHTCNIYREVDDALLMTIPASGTVAHCIEEAHEHYPISVEGIEIETGSTTEEIEDLPEPDAGKLYFVNMAVATAAWNQGRTDVVCPLKVKVNDEGLMRTYGLAVHPSLRPQN